MIPDRHIFKQFDREMSHLHELVLEMGRLAVEQLQQAVITLQQRDVEGAARIIENDQQINDLDVQADDEIVRFIALRQPMASDLRVVIAVSKIVAELERAGDEARKIAEMTIRFYGKSREGSNSTVENAPSQAVLQDLCDLAEYVRAMLSKAMRAFDVLDVSAAVMVLREGFELEERLHATQNRLGETVQREASDSDAKHFVKTVLGLRALERFGGHAKNIAGHIVFITHGIDIRHEDVENILKQVGADSVQ